MNKYFLRTLFFVWCNYLHDSLIASHFTGGFDEDKGSFEGIYMKATYKRITELEKEGLLNVDSSIRIRDNFNRLNEQLKNLKKQLETCELFFQKQEKRKDDIINSFRECFGSKQEGIPPNKFENCREMFTRNFITFALNRTKDKENFHNYSRIESLLPVTCKNKSSCEEKVGTFEISYMSTAYERIKELKDEGILDVKEDIRLRDNINRVNRQIKNIYTQMVGIMKKENDSFSGVSDFKFCIDKLFIDQPTGLHLGYRECEKLLIKN